MFPYVQYLVEGGSPPPAQKEILRPIPNRFSKFHFWSKLR